MTVDEAIREARKRWKRASAYRVGYIMGEAGHDPVTPDLYRRSAKAIHQFSEGVVWGAIQRERQRKKCGS
jgi:hypothetical protein